MLGVLALFLAIGGAGWLLMRLARGGAINHETRNVTLFKGVVFLGLAGALFAAKLWPLAFMTLLAAGAVTAIELWRAREIKAQAAGEAAIASARPALKAEEAASILGLEINASAQEIRAAHKKLIGQLHPDKGGTDYLAAQINDARAVMLARAEAADAAESQKPRRSADAQKSADIRANDASGADASAEDDGREPPEQTASAPDAESPDVKSPGSKASDAAAKTNDA